MLSGDRKLGTPYEKAEALNLYFFSVFTKCDQVFNDYSYRAHNSYNFEKTTFEKTNFEKAILKKDYKFIYLHIYISVNFQKFLWPLRESSTLPDSATSTF